MIPMGSAPVAQNSAATIRMPSITIAARPVSSALNGRPAVCPSPASTVLFRFDSRLYCSAIVSPSFIFP